MIITNARGEVFWGKRCYGVGWQFPQGGMAPYETLQEAMFRELAEETGLSANQVEIMAITPTWFTYELPKQLRRPRTGRFVGQRQRWFLLRLKNGVTDIKVGEVAKPEFSDWRWVNYWYPLEEVIFFKRRMYEQVLRTLAPYNVVSDPPTKSCSSDAVVGE